MADDAKAGKPIPSWQQAASPPIEAEKTETTVVAKDEDRGELVDVARHFLKDDSIRNAPRYDKVEYLKEKGLSDSEVETLLAEHDAPDEELKTVHDSTVKVQAEARASETASPSSTPSRTMDAPLKQELPPIITYPEFLLKPEKPPPLITVPRLINAAYVVAGVSALTWGASKYIIEPMLQTLTEARHDFASTTLDDMEKLNRKLEGIVSHVPYIATSTVKRQQEQEDDVESLDSDPTELFHRDIATQTSPGLSRASSTVSLTKITLDPTIAQSERLSGLSYSLRSLAKSIDHSTENEKFLQKTVKDFQQKLDNMESSYSLLKNDYYTSTSSYSSASNDAKKAGSKDNEAQRFKQEIRSLKGAFLSSRNFPTASRPTATAAGYSQR